MFPLLALTALATAFGAYQYGKNKQMSKQQNSVTSQTKNSTTTEDDSVAKNVNTYNYYTSEAENGNTLFNQNKKRTLFGTQQS